MRHPGLIPCLRLAALFSVLTWILAHRHSTEPSHGGKSASQWVRQLEAASPAARDQALGAFQSMGTDAIPRLSSELCVHPGPVQSRARLWLMARLPGLNLDLRPASRRRLAAAKALAELGPLAQPANEDLIQALSDPDDSVAYEAGRALRLQGAIALPDLLSELTDGEPDRRRQIAVLLGEVEVGSTQLLPGLQQALLDPEAGVRTAAAQSIAGREPFTARTLRLLQGLLEDASAPVRTAAADALGLAGSRARPALRALLEMALGGSESRPRLAAARAVYRVGGRADQAWPSLVELVADPEVGWRAGLALGEMGAAAAPAVPALVQALGREQAHRPLRTPPTTAIALSHIGAPAVPGLMEALDSEEAFTRTKAAITLGLMGNHALPAEDLLAAHLGDPDPVVRHASALALVALDRTPPTLPAVLNEMLEVQDDYIRLSALDALHSRESE